MYGLGLVAERMCIYALGTGDKDASLEGKESYVGVAEPGQRWEGSSRVAGDGDYGGEHWELQLPQASQ